MNYNKVSKMELVNTSIQITPIGYIAFEDEEAFRLIHGFPFNTWVEENPNLPREDFFQTTPFVYLLNTVDSIEGLSLITNLNNPEI